MDGEDVMAVMEAMAGAITVTEDIMAVAGDVDGTKEPRSANNFVKELDYLHNCNVLMKK